MWYVGQKVRCVLLRVKMRSPFRRMLGADESRDTKRAVLDNCWLHGHFSLVVQFGGQQSASDLGLS